MSKEKKELEREVDEKIELEERAKKADNSYHHELHKKGKSPTPAEKARPGYLHNGG